MASTNETLKVVAHEDGSSSVVKVDPANPRLLEVIATFYDAARAQDYAKGNKVQKAETIAEQAAPAPTPAEETEEAAANGAASELSARQSAVLQALRAKKDERNLVETKAGDLAAAAEIPLGSLHSVLGSLEKKQLIKTTRPGSPRASAVYEVL